jgi:hypothetical protein
MASILRVNTLTDASSNNSIATSFVAGGSAKAWNFFDGSAGTISYADSFNSSTLTDIGTGNHKYAFTNNMGNANFSFGGAAIVDETTFGLLTGTEIAGSHARSTSSSGGFFTTNTASVNSSANANSISTQIFGDLA